MTATAKTEVDHSPVLLQRPSLPALRGKARLPLSPGSVAVSLRSRKLTRRRQRTSRRERAALRGVWDQIERTHSLWGASRQSRDDSLAVLVEFSFSTSFLHGEKEPFSLSFSLLLLLLLPLSLSLSLSLSVSLSLARSRSLSLSLSAARAENREQ